MFSLYTSTCTIFFIVRIVRCPTASSFCKTMEWKTNEHAHMNTIMGYGYTMCQMDETNTISRSQSKGFIIVLYRNKNSRCKQSMDEICMGLFIGNNSGPHIYDSIDRFLCNHFNFAYIFFVLLSTFILFIWYWKKWMRKRIGANKLRVHGQQGIQFQIHHLQRNLFKPSNVYGSIVWILLMSKNHF